MKTKKPEEEQGQEEKQNLNFLQIEHRIITQNKITTEN